MIPSRSNEFGLMALAALVAILCLPFGPAAWAQVPGTTRAAAAPSQASPGDEAPAAGSEFRIFNIQSVPAEELAQLIRTLVGDDANLRLVADPATNSLVFHGSTDDAKELEVLLQALDRRQVTIRFQLWVVSLSRDQADGLTEMLTGDVTAATAGDRLAKAQEDGLLQIIERFDVSTLENVPAMVQVGKNAPFAVSEQQVSRGRGGDRGSDGPLRQRAFQYHDHGAKARLQARWANGQVVVELNYESSSPRLAPQQEAGTEEFVPTGFGMRQLSLTASLPNGAVAVLGGGLVDPSDQADEWRLILAAEAQP